jgi:hypothetical protein
MRFWRTCPARKSLPRPWNCKVSYWWIQAQNHMTTMIVQSQSREGFQTCQSPDMDTSSQVHFPCSLHLIKYPRKTMCPPVHMSAWLKGLSHQFEFGQKWYGWKLLICSIRLQFLIRFNKTAVLIRNQQNISDICGDTLGNRPGILASYWLETRLEMHPAGLHFYLGISQVYPLLSKGCWKGLHFPKSRQYPVDTPQMVFTSF